MSTAYFNEIEVIVANAPVGIAVTCDRRLVRYNRKFSEMFGFAGDEGVGQDASVLFSSLEACDALRILADSMFSLGKPLRTELCMRRQDGTLFPAELIACAVDVERADCGTVWIVDGLTDRRLAQAETQAKAEAGGLLSAAGIGPGGCGGANERESHLPVQRGGVPPPAACGDLADFTTDPLFGVPGLDVGAGLRRVGGKMDHYRRQLRLFLDSQREVLRDINIAITAANFQLAARLVHALKGVAGNIGALPLSQLAAETDDAIREKPRGKLAKACLLRLDLVMEEFCVALAAALGAPRPDGGTALVIGRVIEELAARLRRWDGEVADYFDAHDDVLRETLSASDFDALATAVRKYDFAAALTRLESAAGREYGGES